MSVTSKLLKSSAIQISIKTFLRTNRFFSAISPNIIQSDLKEIIIPNVSIPEYIIPKFAKFERVIAVECGITGRKYTYGDLIKKSKNFDRSLRKKLNLKKGDVIALLLPNIPEFPVATLGALQAGLTVTTLNPVYTAEEISKQLKDSSAKVLVTLAENLQTVNNAFNILKRQLPIVVIKTEHSQSLPQGVIDFFEFADNAIDYPDCEPQKAEDVAFLPYSSGTTGLPKGVQLTHYNIVSNVCQNDSPEFQVLEETSSTHQDIIPTVLPMFHIYGFTVNTLFTLSKGTKLVTLPKFTTDDYAAILRNQKPHVLFVVPPIVLFLSLHPMIKPEDLQSVRLVFSGAAPLGGLDEQKFIQKAGRDIHMLQGYGLTETSPTVSVISIALKAEKNVFGSIGRPVANTMVKVVAVDDPLGTPLGPNITGEFLVKGPQVMKGYLNRPEDTANAFLDGWFRTGDMVYYNDDRVLFVTDRLKELIKVKGFQVAPAELEEVIRNFPNVEDAAVIGVPHPIDGESPRAYIVPKKDAKINIKALEEHVKEKVAHYKQLKGGVEIVDSIPKNASGKILRRRLKLEYEKSSK